MTQPVETPYNSSTANGATTVFPYTFTLFDAGDLFVYLNGVLTNVGFTVQNIGVQGGGTITFAAAPAAGTKVLRLRQLTIARATDYQQNGGFKADNVDRDFDRIWQTLQQLNQNTIRSIKLPIDTVSGQEITADAATRAFKTIRFDINGDVALSSFDPDAAQQAGSDAATYAAAAAASAVTSTTQATNANNSAVAAAASALAAANTPVAVPTHAAASKPTPVDADEIPLVDSAAAFVLKRLTWANLKATLKTYFDGLYVALGFTNSIQGAFKNLVISATGTNATITLSVDEITVESAANTYLTLRAVALAFNGTAVGANGIDAGVLAINTRYSVWIIWNGAAYSGLLSLSATAPTLPGGYTHKARVGWIVTDGTANKYPLSFTQMGRTFQFKIAAGSNVPNMPIIASGVAGAPATPTWVAVSLNAFVPTTASKVFGTICSGSIGMVAPNNNYGSNVNITNPPPVSTANPSAGTAQFSFILESTSIYWATNVASSALALAGWEDNL